MNEDVLFVLILLSALGSALMAGMFFTFSNFVMTALGRMKPSEGIVAMQFINIVILNPLFYVLFMGTALLSLALPLSIIWRDVHPNEIYIVGGSLFYLLGVMVVTIVRNVPMNNALDAVKAESNEGIQLWEQYLVDWTRWNHVRSITSFLGTLCFILALT